MKNIDLLLKQLLKEEIVLLEKAQGHLVYSLTRVQMIDLTKDLDNHNLEILDSFATRFLRLCEVLINQIVRTCLQLLGEYQKTTIDNLNKAESLDMITSADDMNYIRMLRNKVAHEYVEDEWIEIYKDIIAYSTYLLTSTEMIKQIIDDRKWVIE
ncbi:MAG TPA: hypothetical protein PKD85_17035 [Saprospiraceae bacterium]|nr:hypothetical protein [Saprospiraceae bacterium]